MSLNSAMSKVEHKYQFFSCTCMVAYKKIVSNNIQGLHTVHYYLGHGANLLSGCIAPQSEPDTVLEMDSAV